MSPMETGRCSVGEAGSDCREFVSESCNSGKLFTAVAITRWAALFLIINRSGMILRIDFFASFEVPESDSLLCCRLEKNGRHPWTESGSGDGQKWADSRPDVEGRDDTW
jgi:hypothetical protein